MQCSRLNSLAAVSIEVYVLEFSISVYNFLRILFLYETPQRWIHLTFRGTKGKNLFNKMKKENYLFLSIDWIKYKRVTAVEQIESWDGEWWWDGDTLVSWHAVAPGGDGWCEHFEYTRSGHSTSAVRVTRHTNIIFIYAWHYLRELWWWNGDGEWRWGGDTGQLTYGGSGLTRHQAHDSKHMPAHSDTGQATHLHSSSPGPRQTTIMTLYSVKCHVDYPTAQQRRDENISV